MKKLYLGIGTVAIIAIGGWFVLTNQPKTTTSETTQSTVAGEVPKPLTGSRYVEFSPESLQTTQDKRRVLFFYANWCPLCRPVNEELTANVDELPDDVVVIRVNYNDSDTDQNEKDLAKKYGVTYQHTFVQIDSRGTEVTKWIGGDLAELLSRTK